MLRNYTLIIFKIVIKNIFTITIKDKRKKKNYKYYTHLKMLFT